MKATTRDALILFVVTVTFTPEDSQALEYHVMASNKEMAVFVVTYSSLIPNINLEEVLYIEAEEVELLSEETIN